MAKKRYKTEKIIGKHREAEILLAQGQMVGQIKPALYRQSHS